LRATANVLEVALLGVGFVAEAVAEDAEGGRGVAEVAGDLTGGAPFGEVGAERLVLAVEGFLGLEKEVGGVGYYPITTTDRHIYYILYHATYRNPLWSTPVRISRCGINTE
jgi:hypothetical protein